MVKDRLYRLRRLGIGVGVDPLPKTEATKMYADSPAVRPLYIGQPEQTVLFLIKSPSSS